MTDRPTRHLNQVELSRRWSISPRTLERWRWLGRGPHFLKIGGRVVYRLEEIEAFEAQQARAGTAASNAHQPIAHAAGRFLTTRSSVRTA